MRITLAASICALAVLTAAVPQPVDEKTAIAIPINKRSALTNADKSVNIEALNSHVASVKAKILRGLNNFEKNTGSPHPAILTELQRRGTGAVDLTDDNGTLWYGPISVGFPPRTFTVQLDTGSRLSWTSEDLGKTFTLKYGDGSTVSGEQYSDTVTVAGLTATDQVLGVASEYSSSLAVQSFPPDGLMGMAFQSISDYDAPPVFQSLVSQGQTNKPVFSFKLASVGSELYLGGVNSALYTGDFTYTPVTKEGYWEVNIDGVEGNGRTFLSNIDSIIDTGTTLVIGSPLQVAALSRSLGGTDASGTVGQGFYTFPCNSFPNIGLTFGGTKFPISEETLNLGQVSTGSKDCVSGIVGQDTAASFWIVGDVFLQNVYTTFDIENAQVGFAKLA